MTDAPNPLIDSSEADSAEAVLRDSTAVRALAGRGSLYTAAWALQLSASMVAIPIATRLLPPGKYGVVALSLIVSLLLGGVAAAGLPVVITRTFFDAEGPREARALFPLAVVVALGVIAVAEATSGLWIGALGFVPDKTAIHVGVWTVLPAAVAGMCMSYFRVADRARNFVAVALLSGPGGQFLGVILVAIVARGGPTQYMLGVAAGWILAACFGLAIIRPWRDRLPLSSPLIRSSLALGLPLIPHGIAWTLLALGDRTVIQHVNGSVQVGRYQVAYTVGALGLALTTAVGNAWTPIVFRAAASRRWKVQRETVTTVLTGAAAVAAGLALLGPPLLVLATPSSYHEQHLAGVVAWVAASTLPWVIYGTGTQVLVWSKRTASLAWITPLAAVVNLVLVRLLLDPFGLTGAAAATFVAYVVLAALVQRAARALAPIYKFSSAIVMPWAIATGLIVLGALVPTNGGWAAARVTLALLAGVAALLRLRRLVRTSRLEPPHLTDLTDDPGLSAETAEAVAASHGLGRSTTRA